MPGLMIDVYTDCSTASVRERARQHYFYRSASGVGMLEFMIALLIFSTAIAGLLSVQLAAKKAAHEAARRSVATQLARDILERMHANPGQMEAYRITTVGDSARRLPAPEVDCTLLPCVAEQLAVFDLWQWESALLGESERYTDASAGGLISPRACIATDQGHVTVSISWLGAATVKREPVPICGDDDKSLRRRQLSLTTYIAAR
jgi:type IV pilus assembly protein PilV